MKQLAIFLIPLALFGCGASEPKGPVVSKEPTSIRGWIADAEGVDNGTYRTVETEAARKMTLFQVTNIWVDGAPYVSGGVAENGSFILLDVPPGNITIEFSAPPQIPSAKLVLKSIPGNADVLVPGVILKKDGTVGVADPSVIEVRTAAKIEKSHPTGQKVTVAGIQVPVIETPLAQMMSRRDWPQPPSTGVSLPTVK